MAWNDLTIGQKAQLMRMMRAGGVKTLGEMKHIYDGETEPTQSKERRKIDGRWLTKEQYLRERADTIQEAALQNALKRTVGTYITADGKPLSSCASTFSSNFVNGDPDSKERFFASCKDFAANPEKYGWEVTGPVQPGMEGYLYLMRNKQGVWDHANMISSYDKNGLPLLTYSAGHAGGNNIVPMTEAEWNAMQAQSAQWNSALGNASGKKGTYQDYVNQITYRNTPEFDYKKNKPVWETGGYETYRFSGTPKDKERWTQEWLAGTEIQPVLQMPQVLNNRVEFAKGGKKFGPGGDKSISLPQMIAATRNWLSNPENRKRAALKLGAAAKEGAGLTPLQALMALGRETPEYDELEAYLYGPERFYTQYNGTSRGPLTGEEYQGIPQYVAEINPRGEYVVPKDMKQLVLDAAKNGTNMYINADSLFEPGSVRFDAANHPIRFRYENGRLVADAADLYDFDEGYADRYSEKGNFIKRALLRKEIREMQSVGSPYIVRQEGIPVRFASDGASEDPWIDDLEAEKFEEAFKRGETGQGYNWKGAVENVKSRMSTAEGNIKKNGGPIHIKKKNRGKFTALKKRTGHSASWFKAHGTPAQKKMATFALNARKWKHEHGGLKF